MGADLFYGGGRTDRQTDMTKLIIAFCNFANAPRIEYNILWVRVFKDPMHVGLYKQALCVPSFLTFFSKALIKARIGLG